MANQKKKRKSLVIYDSRIYPASFSSASLQQHVKKKLVSWRVDLAVAFTMIARTWLRNLESSATLMESWQYWIVSISSSFLFIRLEAKWKRAMKIILEAAKKLRHSIISFIYRSISCFAIAHPLNFLKFGKKINCIR